MSEKAARDYCREVCAQMGEPPCFQIGPFPNEQCDEPECKRLARALPHPIGDEK